MSAVESEPVPALGKQTTRFVTPYHTLSSIIVPLSLLHQDEQTLEYANLLAMWSRWVLRAGTRQEAERGPYFRGLLWATGFLSFFSTCRCHPSIRKWRERHHLPLRHQASGAPQLLIPRYRPCLLQPWLL